MLPHSHQGDGSLKLRGLLYQSAELLRQRQFKKAYSSAQIAKEFAVRSGEAPEVAYRARLLIARIHTLRAYYAYSAVEATHARQALDALDAEAPPVGAEGLSAEVELLRAELTLLTEGSAVAKTAFSSFLQVPEHLPGLRFRALAGLAEALQAGGDTSAEELERLRRVVTGDGSEEAMARNGTGVRGVSAARILLAEARQAASDNRTPQSIDLAQLALSYATRTDAVEQAAKARVLLGSLSRRRDNSAIALRLLYAGLETAETIGHAPLIHEADLEIGRVYEGIQNDHEADKHFLRVAEAAEQHERPALVYAAALALGRSAQRVQQREEASAWLGRALTAAKQLGDVAGEATALAELADLHCATKNYEIARHYVRAAIDRFEEAGRAHCGKTKLVSAFLAAEDGERPVALGLASAAEEAGGAEGRPEIVAAALRLQARLLQDGGNLAEALRAQRAATDYLVRVIGEHRGRQLADLDMRAALRDREREIEKLTRENELKGSLLEKNEEIAQANADLLQANEELRQFAFVASHDLKEPLRQIGSYVSLLKRKYASEIDADGQAYFGFVSEGVARLNRLFDSLMHYTAVARLDKDVRDVDLTRVVDSVRQEFAATMRANGAELHYHTLPTVQTGGKLVRHVVAALIDNALRFGREGVPNVIHVESSELDGMVCISVRDNGLGIPQNFQDKVFQLFQMLAAKSGNPGTGVGLAIAQKTVQRLGGRIWYEDNADGSPGVTFRFTLPMGVERDLPAAALAAVPAGATAVAEEAA